MDDDRYTKHSAATALCVELVLDSIEDDLQRELDAATGQAAMALTRVLNRVKQRREVIKDLIPKVGGFSTSNSFPH